MSNLAQARARLFALLDWTPPEALADEALTHRSFTNEAQLATGGTPPKALPPAGLRNNQRLEFLGDAVLSVCVSELLMQAHPSADEGALSRMRSTLVRADHLAEFGRSLGLGDTLRLGRGAHASGDRNQKNVLADAVEALVGAAYLDGGLDRARPLVRRIVGDALSQLDPRGQDPKSTLQELVQVGGRHAPAYRLASTEGPENDRWFLVEVLLDDAVLAQGKGRSKKLAEQEAARLAIAELDKRTQE